MRKKINLVTLVMLIVSVNVFVKFISAQQPKTVTDFYLLMPADQFSTYAAGKTIKGKAALKKFRKSLIKVEDISNGYIRLEEPGKVWSEIAIFKKNDGSYIVGYAGQLCPNCISEMDFFSYNKGKWLKITNDVLPDTTLDQIVESLIKRNIDIDGIGNYFMMPRKGRTLRWICDECKTNDGSPFAYDEGETFKSEVDGKMKYTLFTWDWNGEIFVLNQ